MPIDIPTEADWRSEAWCLDCEWAYKRFAGKTREEAMAMFADNALLYQEDVMFMPKRCFGFYAIAYADYLTSDLSLFEDAGASCFVGIVEIRHADIRQERTEVREAIIRTLRAIETNPAWYVDKLAQNFYAGLAERARAALVLIGAN